MIAPEIRKMYDILVCFLGPSKSDLDETYQLQFSCPNCQDRDGIEEKNKYHLEVNLQKGIYHCWKCSSIDDSMRGSVYKLIRKYGNAQLLKAYKNAISDFKLSSLYKIHFTSDDFKSDMDELEKEGMVLPKYYQRFTDKDVNTKAFKYLSNRGIDWYIINKFNIGYSTYHNDDRNISNRIIIPSFDGFGDVNYWTGRDYSGNDKRQRYYNPNVERKNIIFNEDKIQWNADINLVEGPFDHIIVPNSIPLLGKELNSEFVLFHRLVENANANINIFLDADAVSTVKKLYKRLNDTKLRDRIRYIPIENNDMDLDPSKIFELWGRKGIISFLKRAKKFKEQELLFVL